jgi:hypothetical protein
LLHYLWAQLNLHSWQQL